MSAEASKTQGFALETVLKAACAVVASSVDFLNALIALTVLSITVQKEQVFRKSNLLKQIIHLQT